MDKGQEASHCPHYESDAEADFSYLRPDDPVRDARILSAVARRANELISKTSASNLGPLSVVTCRYETEVAGWPQLRSAPRRGLGGAEFRFDVSNSGPGLHPADCLGKDFIVAACHHVGVRDQVKLKVKEAKTTLKKALQSHDCQFPPVEVSAIGVNASRAVPEGRIIIELDMLGDDLTRGVHRIRESGLWTIEEDLEKALTKHDERSHVLASALANRTLGSIEETARLVMSQAGLDLEEVKRALQRRHLFRFYFDGRRKYGELQWKDGVLKCSFEDNITRVRIWDNVLSVNQRLPETVMVSLVGRRIGDAIQHPLVPGDAIVTRADWVHEVTKLTLAVPTSPLPGHA